MSLSDVDAARADATRSSGGGVAFLLAYAATLPMAGLLTFVLPLQTTALVVLYQGGVALPTAFALGRLLGFPTMDADNPLRSLLIQLAMVQVVALPAVLLTYTQNPAHVPTVFAAIVGGHFLPYTWLHRTWLYALLGVVVSVGSLGLTAVWGEAAFHYVPLFWSGCFWIAALALWRLVRHQAG